VRKLTYLSMVLGCTAVSWAGPYASSGISKDDSSIVGWATGADIVRGPQSIANPTGALASYGSISAALGKADNSVISLGDGGYITLTFDAPIGNGSGADFAVFENGMLSGGKVFAELGFVEVSSNGSDFFRFPSISLTPTATQVGGFGTIDPTDIHNLAGQFASGQGSLFDLSDLSHYSALNINNIIAVRIVDAVGSINPLYATYDSMGNIVNDPWPTPFASSGFDFDGIGVIHTAAVPEPVSATVLGLGLISIAFRKRRAKA